MAPPPRFAARLPLLYLLCACVRGVASPPAALVVVQDLSGAEIARAEVPVPPPYVPGRSAMTSLHASGALKWKYTAMGADQIPVVTELAGLRSSLPRTAWILTHVPAGGRPRRFNVGMGDVDVRAGDVLEWRLWSLADMPPAEPAPPDTRGDEDAAEDADDDEADAAYEAAFGDGNATEGDGGEGGDDGDDDDDDDYYDEDDAAWADDAPYDDADIDAVIAAAAREREAALEADHEEEGEGARDEL